MGSPRCALSVAVKENGMLVYVCVLSKGDGAVKNNAL